MDDSQRVKETGERLHARLLDRASYGVVVLGPDARLRYVNSAFARLVGKAAGDLPGREVFELLPREREAEFRGLWAELAANPGASRVFELFAKGPDGKKRWLAFDAQNLFDDPEIGGVLASCSDVSDHKRVEKESREARDWLDFMFANTDVVTYACKVGDHYPVTFISESVARLTGYRARDFLEVPNFWADHLHPDDRGPLFAQLPQAVERGHDVFEYRFRFADGRYRWVRDSMRVIHREGRKELIGYWLDIDDRKRTEVALRQSEETFRTLVEHLPVATLIHRGMQILYGNPAMLRLLGFATSEEFCAADPRELVHPDFHPLVLPRIENVRDSGRLLPLEQTLLRKDRSPVVVEAEGFSFRFQGEPATVVLMRDLTERRDLLARMAVTDRLVSMGMLAAGVAHEMNTPLGYVSANLALLAESLPRLMTQQSSRVPPAHVAALVSDCQDGVERLVNVVKDLRTLSQAEEDKRCRVEVRGPIQSAIKMARNDLRHRARLVERYEDGLFVYASEGKLVQLFLNLLMNALHAVPEGGVERHQVTVSACRRDQEVVIEIADTGEGIPPEVLPRIFDPFYTTKGGVGTGLGLPICQGIVRLHGGRLEVQSTIGKGTTVIVSLPAQGEGEAARPEGPLPPSKTVARVLVVDDEVRYGTTLKFLLAPHEVVSLANPREALSRLFGGERFDVILCDLMMPAMNGMDFYAELLKVDPVSARRIVFLTGGAFNHRAKEFLASVPNPCLEKPATERELRLAIDALL